MRQRDDKKVTVGSSMDIRADPKSGAKEQALTLGDIVLEEIVRHVVCQPRIAHADMAPVSGEVEAEELTAQKGRRCCADNHVA